MNPAGKVTWGHNAGITCSISTQHSDGTFILQKTSGSFRKTQTCSNSATFIIPQVNFDNEGSYQCQYQTQVSNFSSPLSDSLKLKISIYSTLIRKGLISMNPASEVTWGHNAGITCSISTQHSDGTFILQKTSGSFKQTQTCSNNSATFIIPQVNFDNEGSYQCQYQTQVSSRDFSSPLSDSVRLSVTGKEKYITQSLTLPRPTISINPAGEVTWGQDVGITCSISTQHLGGTLILQKTSGLITKTQRSSTNSTTFRIVNVNIDNEGSYRCQYQTQVSGQDFSSPLSDSVRLSVTGKEKFIFQTGHSQLKISMNPAGEVTWGHNAGITCSISTQHSDGTFILQKTSGSFRKTQTCSNNSATFIIPQVHFDNGGSYQCQYQTQVSSRDFSSPLSDSVRLSVTGKEKHITQSFFF
uniref:Ig-like domain-containing protein n=1 Tax=Dicentrarchus labrax TaxID=13489 RepID=A0A8C4IM46_DICLA